MIIMHPQKGKNVFMVCTHTLISTLFLIVILNFHDYSNGAFTSAAGSPVKFLPGFDGPLPFELETGYIGVGESEDIQLFYYFFQSEQNPQKDPLLIWLSGGPGCSSVYGMLYEIGPMVIVPMYNHGRFPKLLLNPYSWTKYSSIIFIDQPVGTGFSYARNTKASRFDFVKSCEYVYEFLRKWLVDHPQFISNQVYIAGDSYSGQTVPIITQFISDGNDIGLEPKINLEGYVLGNPGTTPATDDYKPQFAHGMGLISNELFESMKTNCRGIYHDIDPVNTLCIRNMEDFDENIANINPQHILETSCVVAVPKQNKLLDDTRIMYEKYDIHEDSPNQCREEGYKILNRWANYENVQEAIHVRKGTIGKWKDCTHAKPYYINTIPYHANLSMRGYRSLIYNGDHDMVITYIATEAWIKSLNYSIIDDWRPWIVDSQVGGYTRTYANRMTFATVKGAGHIAPEYKPRECLSMFERWISYQRL